MAKPFRNTLIILTGKNFGRNEKMDGIKNGQF
jgi:hypothetical protein